MKALVTAALLLALAAPARAVDAPKFDAPARIADLNVRYQANRAQVAALETAAQAMQKEAEALQEIMKRDAAPPKTEEPKP